MIKLILNRILVQLGDLQREVDLGDGRKLIVDYGDAEKRHAASITEGTVVDIGPDAYKDWGYQECPLKVGDRVQFAKFAPRAVLDPDNPTAKLAVMNDEDVIAIIKSKEKPNE
jgi:co-chaperonin GroES (HSP10)